MFDIKKIVDEKINEMVKSESIEKLIQKSVEESITEAVSSVFGGYSFKRDLEDKFKKETNMALKKLDFKTYSNIMINQMKKVIKEYQNVEFAERVEKEFSDVFVPNDGKFDLEKLFEEIREGYADDWECSPDDRFTLISEESSGGFLQLYFDERQNIGKYECKNCIGIYTQAEVSHIYILRLGNVNYDKGEIKISNLCSWERKLLQAYFNKIEFDISEFDADYVDTTLSDLD